jgi:hypothetical protein
MRFLLDFGFAATTLAILGSLAVHYLYGGCGCRAPATGCPPGARAHLTSLIAFFVLLKAARTSSTSAPCVLEYNSGTELWGAGYTDVNALLPAKEILAYISIVVAIAIVVFSNARMRNLVWAGAALACSASPRWRSVASTRRSCSSSRSSRTSGQGSAVHRSRRSRARGTRTASTRCRRCRTRPTI